MPKSIACATAFIFFCLVVTQITRADMYDVTSGAETETLEVPPPEDSNTGNLTELPPPDESAQPPSADGSTGPNTRPAWVLGDYMILVGPIADPSGANSFLDKPYSCIGIQNQVTDAAGTLRIEHNCAMFSNVSDNGEAYQLPQSAVIPLNTGGLMTRLIGTPLDNSDDRPPVSSPYPSNVDAYPCHSRCDQWAQTMRNSMPPNEQHDIEWLFGYAVSPPVGAIAAPAGAGRDPASTFAPGMFGE